MKVEIFAVNISARLNDSVDDWLKYFSIERQQKILSYRFNADRNRTLWAELMARYVVAEKFSCPFEKVQVQSAVSAKSKAALTLKLTQKVIWKLPKNFSCQPNTQK